VFTKEVRRVEGLPDLPATARSGRSRAPSEVPGIVGRPAGAKRVTDPSGDSQRGAGLGGRDESVSGVAGAFGCGAKPPPGQPAGRQFDRLPMPPVMDDEAPSPADGVMAGGDMEFETKPDFDDATSFTHAFGGPNVPTDPARIEAQRSEAPSTMRKFEHGVTVDGRDTFKMAQKLQTNDATLRFLAALNFDAGEGAEPGVEVIDTAIKKAVIFDDEDDAPPPPVQTADPVEIECADVASARATQWTERAPRRSAPRSREPVPDLETAVRAGNVQDMTASFLADLLEDND
jgi:hypothetical protein